MFLRYTNSVSLESVINLVSVNIVTSICIWNTHHLSPFNPSEANTSTPKSHTRLEATSLLRNRVLRCIGSVSAENKDSV